MKCVDNSSQEFFLLYGKPRHHDGVPGDAASLCRPYKAGDDDVAQTSVNVTGAFCRDDALNASATAAGGGGTMTPYGLVEMYLYTVVIPLICLVGIVGNTINLVVLSSIVRNKPMDRMERSATVGMLALAVSDLFFCIAVIPLAFVDVVVISDRLTFALVYSVYHPAIISTFITSSTWLTVVMAVSRYLAICHPLKARIIIGMRFAAGSIAVAFLFSVLLNVPRFFHSAIACVERDAGIRYFPGLGLLRHHGAIDQTYYALYLIIGIILPLAVLAYSNFFLIRAIRNSRRMRRQFQQRGREDAEVASADQRRHQQQQNQSDTTNTITLTLTVIVIMYAVLVSPAEISNIFTKMISTYMQQQRTASAADVDDSTVQSDDDENERQSSVHPDSYNVAVAVGNTLQTMNFACNFVLYCALNVHFRRIVGEMVTCRPWWKWPVARPNASTVAATTYVARNHGRRDHGAVTLTTVPSSRPQRSTSPSRNHVRFDASDIEDFDSERPVG